MLYHRIGFLVADGFSLDKLSLRRRRLGHQAFEAHLVDLDSRASQADRRGRCGPHVRGQGIRRLLAGTPPDERRVDVASDTTRTAGTRSRPMPTTRGRSSTSSRRRTSRSARPNNAALQADRRSLARQLERLRSVQAGVGGEVAPGGRCGPPWRARMRRHRPGPSGRNGSSRLGVGDEPRVLGQLVLELAGPPAGVARVEAHGVRTPRRRRSGSSSRSTSPRSPTHRHEAVERVGVAGPGQAPPALLLHRTADVEHARAR